MTGTESQRSFSAHMVAVLLTGLALAALGGIALVYTVGLFDSVRPLAVAVAYAALALLAATGAVLEWRRHPWGERAGMAAAVVATPLTMGAITNAWWYFAPILGILTLLTFLSLAYRFAVRNEDRHRPQARHA